MWNKEHADNKDGIFLTHHLSQDLVNGSAFFQCTLLDDVRSLLLHEQHECVQWFLDVRFLLFGLRGDNSYSMRCEYIMGGVSINNIN